MQGRANDYPYSFKGKCHFANECAQCERKVSEIGENSKHSHAADLLENKDIVSIHKGEINAQVRQNPGKIMKNSKKGERIRKRPIIMFCSVLVLVFQKKKSKCQASYSLRSSNFCL